MMVVESTPSTKPAGSEAAVNRRDQQQQQQQQPILVETKTDAGVPVAAPEHEPASATEIDTKGSPATETIATSTTSTSAAPKKSYSATAPGVPPAGDPIIPHHRRVSSDSDPQQRSQRRQQEQSFFPPAQIVYNNKTSTDGGPGNNSSAMPPSVQIPPMPGLVPPPLPPRPQGLEAPVAAPGNATNQPFFIPPPPMPGNNGMMMMPPTMPNMNMPPPPQMNDPEAAAAMANYYNTVAMFHQQQIMAMQQQQQQQQQQHPPPMPPSQHLGEQRSTIGNSSIRSTGKRKPQHRRVHSYSGPEGHGRSLSGGSGGSYGSIGDFFGGGGGGPGGIPPLPPPSPSMRGGGGGGSQSVRARSGSGDFSPRDEFRKLVASSSSASPSQSPRRAYSPTPPLSPMRNTSSNPATVRHHARSHSEDLRGVAFAPASSSSFNPMLMNMPPIPMPPTHGRSDSYSSLDNSGMAGLAIPPRPPNRGVYTGLDDDGSAIIPPSPRLSGSLRKLDSISSSKQGGEAVFLVNSERNGLNGDGKKKQHHRHASQRKMHMRQKSAQLFMETVKGEEQLPSCRDISFLLLFVFHLIGIVFLGRTYGYEASPIDDHDATTMAMSDGDDDDLYLDPNSAPSVVLKVMNLVYLATLSGAFAVVVSALTLFLMITIATKLVQVALILAITLSFAWGTMGVGLSPNWIVPVIGLIALAFSVAYAFIVWDRIPFAASNLHAGLSGIKANPGTILIAFIFQALALGWSIYFTFVVFGVYDAVQRGHIGKSWIGMKYVIYSLLGISYYWTLHVFLNIVQVTVAGVIGSWWYLPDNEISTRASDLKRSFFRSCFYSIGSICFGSLVVGPVRVLRQLSAFFRPSSESSSLLCLHQCVHCFQTYLTSCVEGLSDRFSAWSFTYVGLYGYGLIDAGLHASELFETRGWTKIVSDDLVPNVLFLISLVIGGVTAMFAYLIEGFEMLSISSLGVPDMASFTVGAIVGLVVSSVLFGIISSSVNAVIVCFAASPVDFQENHPELSNEMRNSWREVWPGAMDSVDLRVQVAEYMNGGGAVSERHPLLSPV